MLFLQFPLLIFFHLCSSKKCVISPRWERGDDAYIGLDIYIILSISLLFYTFTLSPLYLHIHPLSLHFHPLSLNLSFLSLSQSISPFVLHLKKTMLLCISTSVEVLCPQTHTWTQVEINEKWCKTQEFLWNSMNIIEISKKKRKSTHGGRAV